MPANAALELCAALLRRGRMIDHGSSALTLLAVLVGLSPLFGAPLFGAPLFGAPLFGAPLFGATASITQALVCALVIALGLAEKVWAARVAVDAELFTWMSEHADRLAEHTVELDEALASLGLTSPEASPRPWSQRRRGALALLRRQLLCMAGQCLVVMAVILGLPWLATAP
ncbi:hypothetical protein ACUN9Y_03165 [Halomonas sp. V046]|uniref:hypothetical protein n=1 Tax=Halomonas sp. V046 TaxID=3459611 RepID=UPI004044FD3F